jgi:thiol-disulfide isomerase/thioredoxin
MKKVNFEELELLKKSQEWLLVKFSGVACSPCIRMTDVINQVAPNYPQMTVIEADAMENLDEVMAFGLGRAVPQTFLYHNGVAVNTEKPFHLLGLKSTDDVDKVLSHFIQ